MRTFLLVTFLWISLFSFAQNTIEGTLKPAGNYQWMIAYKLEGSKQDFIAYDTIKQGTFKLTIPKEHASGIYRLVYDVKSKLFIDIFYDKKDIELSLNPIHPLTSVKFLKSDNNIIYNDYLKTIETIEQRLDSLQLAYFNASVSEKKKIQTAYKKDKAALETAQQSFEKKSENLFVHDFITSNKKYYNAKLLETPEAYQKSVNEHFFDYLELNSKTLSKSTFIHDKIFDYIFTLNNAEDKETLKSLRKNAINTTLEKLNNNAVLSQDIQEGLLYNFAQIQDIEMTNFVLNHYLKLPKEHQDVGFINDIKGQLRTAVGNIAPNILWGKDNKETLHLLSGSPYYLVLFWSSGCGHCLKELPKLAEYLKDKPDIKVVAVGLETEESKPIWQKIIAGHPNWIHVYGKDKWKNRYSKAYGVAATPSFYLLDRKKKILAKPDDTEALVKVLAN